MDESKDRIRVRLKVNWLEIEYEGAPAHFREHVVDLVDHILSTPVENAVPISAQDRAIGHAADISGHAPSPADLSTSTIASVLSVKTGSELVLAASAKLLLVDEKTQFTRKDILNEMRDAPGYYKKTYASNLTKSLDALLKADRLRTTGSGVYALSAKEEESLRAMLREGVST